MGAGNLSDMKKKSGTKNEAEFENEAGMGKEIQTDRKTGNVYESDVKGISSGRKKIFYIAFVIMTFIMISLPAVTMPFRLDKEGYEKRQLAAMPRLFEEGVSVMEFPSRFDTYLSENFGLRSYMITLYAGLVYNLVGDSINDKVIAGKDGWLFFYETLDDYTNGNGPGTDELNLLCRSLYLQYEYLLERGIGFIFMVAPNKNSIYGEYMPQRYKKSPAKTYLELLNDRLLSGSVPFINLQELLIANKDKQQLYHKKDTHWNNYGAMLAYREIMKKASSLIGQFHYDDFADNGYTIEKIWQGDLETMLLPAFAGKDYQIVFDKKTRYSFVRPMRTYEDMLIETESTVNDKRLLMFRDSFANALIPFISDAFGYACYSRAVPFDYTLVDRADPDLVVVEIAERNLPQLLIEAPLMPAPLRSGLPDKMNAAENIKALTEVEQAGKHTRIRGTFFSEESLNNDEFLDNADADEIHVVLENGSDRYCFEAFPVLRDGVLGFSMLLDERLIDENIVPAGEYRIHVILKMGQEYFELHGESTTCHLPGEE